MSAGRDKRARGCGPAPVLPLPVTLGDVVDDALARTLSGRPGPCLWCGSASVVVRHADPVSGAVSAVCRACGSEVSGVAARWRQEAAG